MVKALVIWGSIMGGILGFTFQAAANGTGIAQPSKKPPSIREGSVVGTNGKTRTRFFVGGGLRGGK